MSTKLLAVLVPGRGTFCRLQVHGPGRMEKGQHGLCSQRHHHHPGGFESVTTCRGSSSLLGEGEVARLGQGWSCPSCGTARLWALRGSGHG